MKRIWSPALIKNTISQLKIVKNTGGGGGGGWLDSLGSGILVGKINFGVFKNIDLDNIYGVAKILSENENLFQIANL